MLKSIFTKFHLVLVVFACLASAKLNAQVVVTLSQESGSNSSTTLVGGDTDKIIFGVKLKKATTNSANLTGLTILMSQDVSAIITNARLIRSVTADPTDGGSMATVTGTASFSTSPSPRIIFTGGPNLSNLGGSTADEERWFFLQVDILSNAPATTIKPSIGNTEISLSGTGHTINGGLQDGSLYTINALSTSVTQNTTSIATDLKGGETNKAILSFNATTNGSQSLATSVFTLNIDPTDNTLLKNYRLIDNGTSDTYSGGGTPVGTVALDGTLKTVTFNTISTALSGSNKYFFLVADVDATVTAGDGDVTATFTSGTANQGTLTGTPFTGSTIPFIAPNASFFQNTTSIATGLLGGETNKALLSFNATTDGSQSITTTVFTLDIDPTDNTLLSNYRLIDNGTSNTYSGGGTPVGTVVLDGTLKTVTFNTVGAALSGANKYFFLVADVHASVTSTDGSVEAMLTSASTNQGTTSGSSFTGATIPFQDLTATATQVTAAPVITGTVLEAGTQGVVLTGFSLTSNGNQTVNQINFTISNAAGKLSNFKLYATTTAGSTGSLVASSATGSFNTFIENVNSTTKYFYILADVNPAVTSAVVPPTSQITITQAAIFPNAGSVSSLSISRTFTFTESKSTITTNYNGQPSIDETLYNNTESVLGNVTNANSVKILGINVTDGDTDSHSTTLTQLAFNVSNSGNLATISIFSGATKIASQAVVGSPATFTFGSLTHVITDGTVGSPNAQVIDVRVTFKANVTDKQTLTTQLSGVTTLATGSGIASFAGVNSAGGNNTINVVATRLIFIDAASPPPPYVPYTGPLTVRPSPQAGSVFSATVWAVDVHNNRDLDNTANVSLTLTGGSGSLTGGGAQNLVNGAATFTSLSVDNTDTYDLNATDGSSLADANNSNGGTNIDLIVESSGTAITPSNLAACKVGSGNYFTVLPNLVITEADNSDFKSGTNLTFLLILPSGWEFLTPTTTTPTPAYGAPTISYTASKNFTAATFSNFIGTTIAKFTYTVSGTNQKDALTISGLYVKNVDGVATGDIFRSGTSVIIGADDTKSMGTLTTSVSGTVASFGVQELPGNPTVPSTQTTFNISSNAVKLVGSPPGGIFSGSSVILSALHGYTFNPSTIGVGTFPITYTYTEPSGQHCQVEATKSLTVIANYINGLLNSYCTSATPSAISVPQVTINIHHPPAGTYNFKEFVYYEPTLGAFTAMPSSTTFNPSDPIYANSINSFGGVYIGYRAKDAATQVVLPDSDGTLFGFYANLNYIFIRVTRAPILAFNLPSSVCFNAPQIDLDNLVTPSPNSSVTDNFNALTSVSNLPATNEWFFTPNTVAGAGPGGSPQNVNITYNYKDPASSCTNSIQKTITVYPNPGQVLTTAITPATTIEICQGGNPGSFTAQAIVGSYNWYSDNSMSNLKQLGGIVFSPVINNTVPATTDFFVTQIVNGCESTLARQISVVVNPTPAAPGSDFTRSYCLNSTVPSNDFTITGSSVKWYHSIDNFITPIFSGNNPTGADLGISTAVANSYSFQTTQTSNKSCESPPIKVLVTIKDLPTLTITSSVTDLTKICRTISDVNFKANQPNGTWSGTASSALFNTIAAQGSTQLNSLNLAPGTFDLRYDYTDGGTSCSNFATASLTILPTITPSLSVGDACDGFFVELINTSAISPTSSTSTINSIAWDFGDQSSLPARPYANAIPVGFSNVTKGTFQSPKHIFKSVGSFSVNYTMETSDGCFVTGTKSVVNHEVPRAAFAWLNPCSSNGSAALQFGGSNLNTNIIASEIQSYTWNFAKDGSLAISSAGSGKNPTTTYSTTGRDSVQLIVTTINNCKDTIQKPIFIVPSIPTITTDHSYSEDFNTTSGGWIQGGTNASWQHGTPSPANPTINRDSSATGNGKAWITRLAGNNNPNEQSWVLSPCYDFSQTNKPVISLDIWSDTPRQIDGAVLQYNDTDNIENNANWKVLGDIGQGVNWYDLQGIASKPGNQTAFDYGWSGDASSAKYKNGWVHAVFKLDELIGKPNVKLRIAFASNFGRQKGFAFDNVFVGERSRSVLIENFTNTSAEANATAQNNAFNSFGNNAGEIVKIQYHTGFPGYDTLNSINKPMNNARTAYYGITTAPSLRVDGKTGTGPYASWFTNLYDERILSPSPIKITIDTPVKTGDAVNISCSVTNTTSAPLNFKNVNVFVVIAEKSITTAPWLGQSGNTELKFVAKQMLPTPSGISIGKILAPGETFTIPNVLWNKQGLINANNGVIIIYVQSLLGDKEVYQAKVFDNPVQPNIITGTEPLFEKQVRLYPNPADGSVTIDLPSGVLQHTPLQMFDVNGRQVYSTAFEQGEHRKVLITHDLPSGVYLIQIENSDTVIRKKIMVMHP